MKKVLKTLIIGTLVVMLVFILTFGCVSAGKIYRITYISRSMSDPFAAWLANSFVDFAKEKYPNMKLKIIDSQNDASKFVDSLENAIMSKSDGIIIQRVAEAQSASIVEGAVKKGIAVVVINLALEKPGIASTVVADDYQLGKVVAEEAIKNLPQNAKIVMLNGIAGITPTVERRRAYQDFLLKARPDIKLLDEQTANYDKGEAMIKMEDWLQKFPQIDGVVAANDAMALGAIEAYRSSKRDFKNTQFYGIDGLADGCQSIKAGELTATVLQDANDYAVKTLALLDKTLQRKIVKPVVENTIPMLITKNNVDKIIEMHKKSGLMK